jgi:predicted glycoside hydrolase/deacetylase ChbG (UPF0249 family)
MTVLIITADDLGRDRPATDTAMNCFRKSRITSASFMVFMADSERAARLAIDEGLETGLHLNFITPYDAPSIPDALKTNLAAAAAFYRHGPWTQGIYHPFLGRAVASIFRSQLEEYRRLFRREPAFFNGHQHLHLSPNMIAAGLLPRDAAVRRSETFLRGKKKWITGAYRRLADVWLLRSHVSTDAFYNLIPVDDRARVAQIVEVARTSRVELMVHPWMPDNYAFLMGAEFETLTAPVRLGRFAEL